MPDIFDIFNKSEEPAQATPQNDNSRSEDLSTNAPPEQTPGANNPFDSNQRPPNTEELDVPDGIRGNSDDQARAENEQYSNQQLGEIASTTTRDLYEDPDSWSPEFTARLWGEEAAVSIARGIGNHIIKGTGDLIQVAGGFVDPTISDGSMLSRWLQDAGTEMAGKFKAAIPEELQHENLTWGSMANPKLWSITLAEMVPQLAEFVFLSKGGAGVAKAALKKGVKKLPGKVGRTALGKDLFKQGSGIAGKLGTDIGLTTLGDGLAGAVGGGIAGNVFSGMLNAAEVINSNKDVLAPDGSKLFTEEQLAQMAAGTMRSNAAWVWADMASWGMTFGGGYKKLKGINPFAKGGKGFTPSQQRKAASNLFKYDVAPAIKALGRLGGKAGLEGIEETFQESWEEWSKKKGIASVTGEELEGEFLDFYMSKENKGTKVVSFAMGALGGAAFNLSSLINKKADENLKLHDRIKNLTEVTDIKNASKDEASWQSFHVKRQISDIVNDDSITDKDDLYQSVMQSLVENKNLSEDQIPAFDEMYSKFKEVAAKATRLNIKGKTALLHNNATESYADEKLEYYQAVAEESMELLKDLPDSQAKTSKINDVQKLFKSRVKALSIIKAQARQNQENLILGKKAVPLKVRTALDEFGNEMVLGGLSNQQMKEYTEEGDTRTVSEKSKDKVNSIPGVNQAKNYAGKAKEASDKLGKKVASEADGMDFSLSGLSKMAAAAAKKVRETFTINEEGKVDPKEEPKEKVETPEEAEAKNSEDDGSQEASATTVIDGEEVSTPKTKEQAEEEAKEAVEKVVIDDTNETIKNEVFEKFQKKGVVPKSILHGIAEKIYSKEPLSSREEEIRSQYKDPILDIIIENILNIETEVPVKETGVATKETSVSVDDDISVDDTTSIDVDPQFTEAENLFMAEELSDKTKKTVGESPTMKDVDDEKERKAKKKFKVDPKKKDNMFSFDSRSKGETAEGKAERKAVNRNILENHFVRIVLEKLRKSSISETTDLSQNELDNYLNRYTTYNLEGPSAIDEMSVINNALKRMFPDAGGKTPQLIIVRNLLESVGSEALGHMLGATIYIDEKSPNQTKTFMHEMSHIYFSLSEGEPETQALIELALANKALVDDIRNRYDDYTLYSIKMESGEFMDMSKKEMLEQLGLENSDMELLNEYIESEIAAGAIKTIALKDQKYLIDEMFAKQLEGPLSENFDEVFNIKKEPRRERDVKKWWGLLRKKGEIINEENGVETLLRQLNQKEVPEGATMENFLFDTFRAVTKGVKFDLYGRDQRVSAKNDKYQEDINDIKERMNSKATKDRSFKNIFENEGYEDYENFDEEVEEGISFNNKDFDSQKKTATRILKRFGSVYNKAYRLKTLNNTKDGKVNRKQAPIINQELLESSLYNLARENNAPADFILNIEQSKIKEIAAFNRFLKAVYPDNNEQLLAGMHFIFSNGRHITSFRTVLKGKGEYEIANSLNQTEGVDRQNVLIRAAKEFTTKSEQYKEFAKSVENIRTGKETKADYFNVIEMFRPRNFKYAKVLEQGILTHKGASIPIETFISSYVKQGLLYQKMKSNPSKRLSGKINMYEGRLIAEALIATNRKFSNLSTVMNAEHNMESVKITNNHTTLEVDNMMEFLRPDKKGKKPTKEQFLDRYSHVSKKQKKALGKAFSPNKLLEHIYDQMEKGILPTVSQHHGIEDLVNKKGNTFKNSTSYEQRIDELLHFGKSARAVNGKKTTAYLQSLGAYSDSPRKFYMNMKRFDVSELFDGKDGKLSFKKDGVLLNSVFHLHNELFPDEKMSKTKFKESIMNGIIENVKFMEDAGPIFSKKNNLKTYFTNKKLNSGGRNFAAEQFINSLLNGYYSREIFLPGVKGKSGGVKRMKANGSPILSAKNKNFKIEPIPFADTIENNSVSGTDSGMYITERAAQKLVNLGLGVFDMNHGFKLLNSSVEKNNPQFEGKLAFLKGYTTIAKKGHPLYEVLTAREAKYDKYHNDLFGEDPSNYLNDGSFNHLVIAVPQSSDKGSFYPNKFINESEDGTLSYNESSEANSINGAEFTMDALSKNFDGAMKHYDKMFYDKKGAFVGIESYNFGPQQLMDVVKKQSTTPTQMINSIMVGAATSGNMDLAVAIQQHISNQKQQAFNSILEKIASGTMEDYHALIDAGLNKSDMDQAQRIIFEDNGSLAHPFITEIVTNQLAKSLRVAGNKLLTPGTIAHQRPDVRGKDRLKGYRPNADGTLSEAEIELPMHMETTSGLRARENYTVYNFAGKSAIKNYTRSLSKEDAAKQTLTQDLNAIQFGAQETAMKRFGLHTAAEARKHVGEVRNDNGILIGYYVKGDTVMASRIPGHGPSSTGMFEVVAFNSGEGNQVMVSSEFNDIIGADNDGDALFIQHKGINKKDKAEFAEWNMAFDKMAEYWLSKDMKDQIQTKMDIKKSTEKIVDEVEKIFGKDVNYSLPFSPAQRAQDFSNTMVSKNNVGPIFNLHKVANLYAAYNIEINTPITINGQTYNQFKDGVDGQESRNQKSAELANIVLDNASHHYADRLGLDSFNIAQATLLVNLGLSLEEVALILNSKASKVYSRIKAKTANIYNEESNYENVFEKAYAELKIERNNDASISIDTSKEAIKDPSQGGNILELFRTLEELNSETQIISKVMGGHKKIHVNPHVLEKELTLYDDLLSGKNDKKSIRFTEEFRSNPDLRNYENVAREVLKHLKTINPVYQGATNAVLDSVVNKVGSGRLTIKQIEGISNDIKIFQTARLLGLNNADINEVTNLMTPGHENSVYQKVKEYTDELTKNVIALDFEEKNTVSDFDNSILFSQAMSVSTNGNQHHISANRSFGGSTLNPEERVAAQEEFAKLPQDLKDALIMHDLIKYNWQGPQSIAIYFDKNTNDNINMESNMKAANKDEAISGEVLRKLETRIALKMASENNNPLIKVNVKSHLDISNPAAVKNDILSKSSVKMLLKDKNGGFINVRNKKGNSVLYHIPKFTLEEKNRVNSERSSKGIENQVREIALSNMVLVPNDLKSIKNTARGAIDIALIPDKRTGNVYKTPPNNEKDKGDRLNALEKATMTYDEMREKLKNSKPGTQLSFGLDQRVDYDSPIFEKETKLTEGEFYQAMEFKKIVTDLQKNDAYKKYEIAKERANTLAKTVLPTIENKTTEELLSMYEDFGENDAYAFSIIMTPIIKKLTSNISADQSELTRKQFENKDVSVMKAYLMTGSNIPSNHPAAQGMVRMMEKEYKNFINEKKKYITEMNEISDALYKEKLGYGNRLSPKTIIRRIKDVIGIGVNRSTPYERLYGNMVERVSSVNSNGTLVYDYKLKSEKEFNEDFRRGGVTQAEKNFYDHFRKVTKELKPERIKKTKEDYIPHTAMSTLETFASRGILGLVTSAKHEDSAILDVKLYSKDQNGERHLMNFKNIEDLYKMDAANVYGKNNVSEILEYRKLRSKARRLLSTGKNEDGSRIIPSIVQTETVLGFGAINRFANNRSVKATELPSMDLNKALGDYIHTSLFVEGNANFKGMRKLQGVVDGVLAFNREHNLPQLNNHIQKVWKDYFVSGKRQTSILGKKADKVIVGLTRLNLFYSLGYNANKNTGGLYAIGNVLAGKYHNIKDLGGKKWIQGEARFWGLDKGFKGGIPEILARQKRMAKIMKNLNFMEINVYDEVNMEKKNGLDAIVSDLALSPMIISERWIQRVHMLGLLPESELDKFDEKGNYKKEYNVVPNELLIELEDQVKLSHGRGYQPTDQRAIQMYSWGTMMLQFSRFIPTMFHDRFGKEDVNIYGKTHIGSLRAVGDMVKYVVNNPGDFVRYRKAVYAKDPALGKRLDSGLKGMAMSTVIGMLASESEAASGLYGDINYYINHPKLAGKLTPPALQTTQNLLSGLF